MKIRWHNQHKWSGIASCLLLIVFCISGIVLNHREAVAGIDVPRTWLPPFYRYEKWNGGLLRGSLRLSPNPVLIFGNEGIWLCSESDTIGYSEGIPRNASSRDVRAMSFTRSGELMALTTERLYIFDRQWRPLNVGNMTDERLSDMTVRGDSVVVAGRSFIYVATPPFEQFEKIELSAPGNREIDSTSAFRRIWALHSGELFGTAGRLIADAIGIILIFLAASGIIIWLFPRLSRRMIRLHDFIGRKTIIFTLLIVVTGWSLRPPFLIALAQWRVPKDITDNPWHDRLRMIRYDHSHDKWLISTSEGFFALDDLPDMPEALDDTPPVSVMGLNVWEPYGEDRWLCGSFSGLYIWDQRKSVSTDYYTGETASGLVGPPFGLKAVSGYSRDLGYRPSIVCYDTGTDYPAQPDSLKNLPMPLWNVALEAHSGRIYFGASATWFFVLIAGGLFLWCLYSGWKVRRKSTGSSHRGCRAGHA